MKFIDLLGKKFNRLQVLSYYGKSKDHSLWICLCDCGKEVIVEGGNLRSGHTQSCGCKRVEVTTESKTTHGYKYTSTYECWAGMIRRCKNPNQDNYYLYGGRGISVCERWLKFDNFLEDMGEKPTNLTIDRKDYNGNYEPNNCRWATPKEQSNNSSRNHLLTFNGKTQNMKQWSEELGINYSTIRTRLGKGWSIEKVLKGKEV